MSEKKPVSQAAQTAENDAKERALFAQYLSTATALIADPNGSSRVRLGHTLAEMGAKQNGIAFAGNYDDAVSAIEQRKPKIILCEFTLGPHSGLDLLIEQRKLRPETKDCVFALITSNTSQSAVAAAAEEDVDTFIIKPYTLDSLKRTLAKAAVTKLYPSEYIQMIEVGKKQLFSGQVDEAIKTFTSATKMDPKPSLAFFYKGQAECVRSALDDAAKDYKAGLNCNKIHYKCLVGLYELMMQKKQYNEAYSVVKKVAQYFPANPKRLASVLRLAIMTNSYDDIESYYRIFTLIENRNDELVRYICSALIVTGKYYFLGNYSSRALELLEKAAVSAAGKTSFLRYIIEVMVEFEKFDEAQGVLRRFPSDTQGGPDFLSMELLIARKSMDPGEVIQKARDIIKKGIEVPVVYEVLIEASLKAGLHDSANELIRTAVRKWPEEVNKYNAMVAANKSSKSTAPSLT